jgi:hypothetical protein
MAGFYSCGDFYLKLWFQWAQSAVSNGPFTFKLRERAFGEHRQHETERGEAFPGVIILLLPRAAATRPTARRWSRAVAQLRSRVGFARQCVVVPDLELGRHDQRGAAFPVHAIVPAGVIKRLAQLLPGDSRLCIGKTAQSSVANHHRPKNAARERTTAMHCGSPASSLPARLRRPRGRRAR